MKGKLLPLVVCCFVLVDCGGDGISSISSSSVASSSSSSSITHSRFSIEEALERLTAKEGFAYLGSYEEETYMDGVSLGKTTSTPRGYISPSTYYVYDGGKDIIRAEKDENGDALAPYLSYENVLVRNEYYVDENNQILPFDTLFANPFASLSASDFEKREDGYQVYFSDADNSYPSYFMLDDQKFIQGICFIGEEELERVEFIPLEESTSYRWSFSMSLVSEQEASYHELSVYEEKEEHTALKEIISALQEGNYAFEVLTDRESYYGEITANSLYLEGKMKGEVTRIEGLVKVDEEHLRPFEVIDDKVQVNESDFLGTIASYSSPFDLNPALFQPLSPTSFTLVEEATSYLAEHFSTPASTSEGPLLQVKPNTLTLTIDSPSAISLTFTPDVLYEGEVTIRFTNIGQITPRYHLEDVPAYDLPSSWEEYDETLFSDLNDYFRGNLDYLPYPYSLLSYMNEISGSYSSSDDTFFLSFDLRRREDTDTVFSSYLSLLEERGYLVENTEDPTHADASISTSIGTIQIDCDSYVIGYIELVISFSPVSNLAQEYFSEHFMEETNVTFTGSFTREVYENNLLSSEEVTTYSSYWESVSKAYTESVQNEVTSIHYMEETSSLSYRFYDKKGEEDPVITTSYFGDYSLTDAMYVDAFALVKEGENGEYHFTEEAANAFALFFVRSLPSGNLQETSLFLTEDGVEVSFSYEREISSTSYEKTTYSFSMTDAGKTMIPAEKIPVF